MPSDASAALFLLQVQANKQLRELREIAKGVTKQLPGVIQNATAKIDEYARGMISGTGSTLFEELGFYYIGPVDGHNLQDLIDVLTGKLAVPAACTSLVCHRAFAVRVHAASDCLHTQRGGAEQRWADVCAICCVFPSRLSICRDQGH